MSLTSPADWWHYLTSPWRDQRERDEFDTAIWSRLNEMENRMSLTDEALADLDAATNDVADDLDALEAEVTRLLADAGAADSTVAAKITAASARLRSLAADPAQPVPPAEPVADEADPTV